MVAEGLRSAGRRFDLAESRPDDGQSPLRPSISGSAASRGPPALGLFQPRNLFRHTRKSRPTGQKRGQTRRRTKQATRQQEGAMGSVRLLVCGTNYGRSYVEAIQLAGSSFELV